MSNNKILEEMEKKSKEKEEKESRKEECKWEKESQQRVRKLEEDNLSSDEEQEEVLYCFWTINILFLRVEISKSVLDKVRVNKFALFDFLAICQPNILFGMVWKFETLRGISSGTRYSEDL